MKSVSELLDILSETYQCIPILACEIEWYLLQEDGTPAPDSLCRTYLAEFEQNAKALPLHSVDIEDGNGQVEAALLPTAELSALITHMQQLKMIAHDCASAHGLSADFNAKPFPEDYGSGLHVHIHLEDMAGNHLFHKDEDGLSEHLNYAIGGLLHTMADYMPVFRGDDVMCERYVPNLHAPTTISWGMNNRTVALRLPDDLGAVSGHEAILNQSPSRIKRIEHRVSSADADVEQVIIAILSGTIDGLNNQRNAPEPIYGNASDSQYEVKSLIK